MTDRVAVVSCHVERPLDDACWERFRQLQDGRPAGFRVAALLRPPDRAAGEDESRWLERVREAAEHQPIGHHTHFVAPGHARPSRAGPEPAERVREEAAWLREHGLEPQLFCGGGWYMDGEVASALAGLGYSDCTATAFTPSYLSGEAPRLSAKEPVWLRLADGARLLELPTTHSLGMAVRAAVSPAPLPPYLHLYVHDTDLVPGPRRAALLVALGVLARRARASDLDELRESARDAPELPFSEASRP